MSGGNIPVGGEYTGVERSGGNFPGGNMPRTVNSTRLEQGGLIPSYLVQIDKEVTVDRIEF